MDFGNTLFAEYLGRSVEFTMKYTAPSGPFQWRISVRIGLSHAESKKTVDFFSKFGPDDPHFSKKPVAFVSEFRSDGPLFFEKTCRFSL